MAFGTGAFLWFDIRGRTLLEMIVVITILLILMEQRSRS